MTHPLQYFETRLLGNLRFVNKANLDDSELKQIGLELVRDVRDVVIPYYTAKSKEVSDGKENVNDLKVG